MHSPDRLAMGIWVGRYALVAGDVREHGPWLVERERRRDDESVRLLVLAEPLDERSAEFCHEVADAVSELFSRESLSMTGGLLRALQQAHDNLAEWNRRSLREHQVAVGLTCVAIRDGEATIAQAGPGIVYVSGAAGAERLSTEGEPSALPLGGPRPLEPRFHTVRLADHELLLISSEIERVVDPAAIGQTLAVGPQRALAEFFVYTRSLQDATAVLVADLEGADDAPPAPVHLAVGGDPAPEPPPTASIDSADAPAPRRRSPPLPALRRPRIVGAGGSGGGERARLPWRAIALLAAAVVALAAIAAVGLPSLLEDDRAARLEEARSAAELHLDAAATTTDAAERREQLEAALAAISRARSIDAEHPDLAILDARAQAALETIDAVVAVDQLRTVLEFEGALTAPLAPLALEAGGGRLWLLDGERGRLFAIDPAGATPPQERYRSGERYDLAVAGDPLAIAWDEAGQRLLLLDAGRTLFAVSADGPPQPLPLRDAAEIRSAQAIATYAGNLYLLDPEGGEIWRYLPAGEGFDSERDPRLGGVELAAARTLAVDGDLIVLGDDGLRRFTGGGEPAPLLRGIDRPLESPAGLVEDVARGRLYVADRGRRRIVLSGRSGDFLAQFHHPQFFDLRGLALSPDGTELYILTGDGVFAFDPLR